MRNKDEEIKQFLKIPPQGRTGYVKRQHSSLPEKVLLIFKNRIREGKKERNTSSAVDGGNQHPAG